MICPAEVRQVEILVKILRKFTLKKEIFWDIKTDSNKENIINKEFILQEII